MKPIIKKLNDKNFDIYSLDNFQRYQKVTHCWRFADGSYTLLPVEYSEDWDLEERRNFAKTIIDGVKKGFSAYGAFIDKEVVGFALIDNRLFGSKNQYCDLAEFYVTCTHRRQGIGKKLFTTACKSAKALGAKKLYISAHSAEESIAAYKSYGCVLAKEINKELAEKEPCDLQMECEL